VVRTQSTLFAKKPLKNLPDYKEEQAGYSEDYKSIYRDPYQHAQKRSCHCSDGSL